MGHKVIWTDEAIADLRQIVTHIAEDNPAIYEALEETAHLLCSPANARHLLAAIQQLENGKGKVRQIDLKP